MSRIPILIPPPPPPTDLTAEPVDKVRADRQRNPRWKQWLRKFRK